jgi:hypothetical protein
MAAFLDSDESFSIFRGFGTETARLLLIKEIELHQLVTKIHELDKADEADKSMAYRLASIEYCESWDRTLVDLLREYEAKINIYCKMPLPP